MELPAADVAIIGAGLIGASIAWRLLRAGLRVAVVDAGKLGGEASSAGAGMLSPGGEFDKPSLWFDLGVQSMRAYPHFIEDLRCETGLPIDHRVSGCIQVATNEQERRQARNRAEFQRGGGIRVELGPEGLFYPDDAIVDPVDMMRALGCACQARGAIILEHHPVREIESDCYAAVVIAAGAWSDQIRVRHHSRLLTVPAATPVKGHLIGYQLEPGSLGPVLRREHTYVLQRANGFTIAGSTEEHVGFDRSIDAVTCDDLHRRAAQLFPVLEKKAPSHRWVGFRPQTADGTRPYIERVAGTNVWLAYGHYRNGILLTPLTAHRVAGEIVSSRLAAGS